jgi:hypothetical protein
VPTPEFAWIAYDLPAPVAAVESFDVAAAAASLHLPDLRRWPRPEDKVAILLRSAAEVEHALMVQYLYAAYSLKTVDEVEEPERQAALDTTSAESWPRVVLRIAREEMGHLMTVQNLLTSVGLSPNLEREDFPPRKDLYPFALHLEPLSQRSLAKYVAAEAPAHAEGIEDIVALAQADTGSAINRVGVLYGLLGLVVTREEDVQPGGSGSASWDAIVRDVAFAAYQQAPPDAWHLPDTVFSSPRLDHQADPDDWGSVHVHRIAARADAIQALRDIAAQGEGPSDAGETSHFERFRLLYRGSPGMIPFPAGGDWTPTRSVPTDPSPATITDPRAKGWAALADARYALLLGFVEHYLLAAGDQRRILTGWIFAEMRSRLAVIATRLTDMPAGQDTVGAAPFTMPALHLPLPTGETARWAVHRERTDAAIRIVETLQAAGNPDAADTFLGGLVTADRARRVLIDGLAGGAPPLTTSFVRDIEPLFRPIDIEHMSDVGFDLSALDTVRVKAQDIVGRLTTTGPHRMPPAPDEPWSVAQVQLLQLWVEQGGPP